MLLIEVKNNRGELKEKTFFYTLCSLFKKRKNNRFLGAA